MKFCHRSVFQVPVEAFSSISNCTEQGLCGWPRLSNPAVSCFVFSPFVATYWQVKALYIYIGFCEGIVGTCVFEEEFHLVFLRVELLV